MGPQGTMSPVSLQIPFVPMDSGLGVKTIVATSPPDNTTWESVECRPGNSCYPVVFSSTLTLLARLSVFSMAQKVF